MGRLPSFRSSALHSQLSLETAVAQNTAESIHSTRAPGHKRTFA